MHNLVLIDDENSVISDDLTESIYELVEELHEVVDSTPWLVINIKNIKLNDQGWKGHISTRVIDSIGIAKIAIPILIKNKCSFKIVKNIKQLSVINGLNYPVSGANKFITFYPSTYKIFRKCILELKEALKSFKAPRIHTDMQCGLNSPVHYRYGGFIENKKFDKVNNKLTNYIKDLSGNLVEDKRSPWYEIPEWVDEPHLYDETTTFTEEELDKLNSYQFIGILNRANKGNVYLAKKMGAEDTIIIKESNPYIYESESDIHAALNNEYNVLLNLDHLKCVPNVYDKFYCSNKMYIVQERINGETLLRRVLKNTLARSERMDTVNQLVDCVQKFHNAGYVLNDIKPDNIMIDKNGDIKFIDVEAVNSKCDKSRKGRYFNFFTPGFYNYEMIKSGQFMENDWFATINTILTIYTGTVRFFQSDFTHEKLGGRTHLIKLCGYIEKTYIEGLLDEEVYSLLKNIFKNRMNQNYIKLAQEDRVLNSNIDIPMIFGAVIDGFSKEIKKGILRGETRVWKSTEFGEITSSLNIQHGISGIGGVLLNYINYEENTESLLSILNYFAEAFKKTINFGEQRDRDFLFGDLGSSWFVYDLGEYLKDDALISLGKDMAIKKYNHEHYDFALGTAGDIYTKIYFYQQTGNIQYLDIAIELGYQILHNYPTNKTDEIKTYGFAHGYSGIAYVLYSLGILSGKDDFIDYAQSLVEIIIDKYEELFKENADFIISWCNGISGVGAALVRINHHMNDKRIEDLLEKIPAVLVKSMYKQSNCQCHGNSSSIEFLMDAYQITGENFYYDAAKKISDFIKYQYITTRNGSVHYYNETKFTYNYDYGIGTMGTVNAIYRVHNMNSKRLFYIDPMTIKRKTVEKKSGDTSPAFRGKDV